jgi:hypothetical protein
MAAVAVAVVVLCAGGASAAETTVIVSRGSLALFPAPAASDFVEVTLDGAAQETAAALDPFSLVDARGAGAGWTLTVGATQFREWDGAGYVDGGETLPLGSLLLPPLAIDPAEPDPNTASPATAPSAYRIDGASVVVGRAEEGAGMGTYLVTPSDQLVLALPASAYAGTYRSELSITVSSGP